VAEKKARSLTSTIGLLLLFPVLVFSCLAILQPEPKTPEEQAAADAAFKETGAYARCESETKARIADRSGMTFPPYREWVRAGAEDRAVLTYTVRAKNAYGALIWANMVCSVEWDGEFWTVTDLVQDQG
jgi:hypothetical protein